VQTHFTPEQLADPRTQALEKILRSCVHCGFCTATCPTYVVSGDERDSPRGRIYLIKDLLGSGRAPTDDDVWPIDHCLSCNACMTTCPSGVEYRRLIDHARVLIETRYTRPLADRLMRAALARLLPSRTLFALGLRLGALARPFAPLIAALPRVGPQLAAMLALAPKRAARAKPAETAAASDASAGAPRRRVALLTGCAQAVLAPEINAATTRLLARAGVVVAPAPGEGCCGSLLHHMGREAQAHTQMRANIDAWTRAIDDEGLEAIVVTTSGCGATIKDYGALLADDPAYADKAARIAALARDVTEYVAGLDLAFAAPKPLVVAYHAACTLQHGQKIVEPPKALLIRAGFEVRNPAESHLCCGSAGTYNILHPETAAALRARKVANLERLKPDVVAAGNIGCLTQIASATAVPVVHTVELLDWASGGPAPAGLED
jgi:glycolate oxidase iron-sulfur subunit